MILTKPLFSLLSPAGSAARLSVFIFHRVLPRPDPFLPGEPDQAQFDQMLTWIKGSFRVLPLDEAVARLGAGTLPARTAAITFDDGYADNATLALPLLKKHGLPATVFVATAFLNGGCMWNDRITETLRHVEGESLDLTALGLSVYRWTNLAEKVAARDQVIMGLKYLPLADREQATLNLAALVGAPARSNLMMSTDQVRMMRAQGWLVGAHTRRHPILAKLAPEAAALEISEGKRELEEMLGEPVALFAYPNGRPDQDYRRCDVEAVKAAGFRAAVSTAWGAARRHTDPFQIPRFTPWDRSKLRFQARLLRNLAGQDAAVAQT